MSAEWSNQLPCRSQQTSPAEALLMALAVSLARGSSSCCMLLMLLVLVGGQRRQRRKGTTLRAEASGVGR